MIPELSMGEAQIRGRRGDFCLTLKVRCGIRELFVGGL
jgi:hypothetical protein